MNSLPKTVTRQCRGCDLNPGPTAPESSTLTTRLPSHNQNSQVLTRTCEWTDTDRTVDEHEFVEHLGRFWDHVCRQEEETCTDRSIHQCWAVFFNQLTSQFTLTVDTVLLLTSYKWELRVPSTQRNQLLRALLCIRVVQNEMHTSVSTSGCIAHCI